MLQMRIILFSNYFVIVFVVNLFLRIHEGLILLSRRKHAPFLHKKWGDEDRVFFLHHRHICNHTGYPGHRCAGSRVFTEFLVLFSVTFQEKIEDDEKNSLAIIDFPEKW